jgi:hypothetical protein
MSRRITRALLGISALFCLAPTPGDIGGCGQAARDLDPAAFFASKRAIECLRCRDCGIRNDACERACTDLDDPETEFPVDCYPLVHDGTVCLRALTQASCEDHRRVMGDPPRVPSECNFCPPLVPDADPVPLLPE